MLIPNKMWEWIQMRKVFGLALIIPLLILSSCDSGISQIKGKWYIGMKDSYSPAETFGEIHHAGSKTIEFFETSVNINGLTIEYKVVESGVDFFIVELSFPAGSSLGKVRQIIKIISHDVIKYGDNFYISDLGKYPPIN